MQKMSFGVAVEVPSPPSIQVASAYNKENSATRLRRTFGARVRLLDRSVASAPSQVGVLALYVAESAGLSWLCHLAMQRLPWLGWLFYAGAILFTATRFRLIGNMVHEASHGFLARGVRANQLLGNLVAVLDFTDLPTYRREHFTHHRHLGDPVRDLDFAPRQRFGFNDPERSFLWTHCLRPLTLFHLPRFIRPQLWNREDTWPVAVGRMVYIMALAALAAWVGWRPFLLFWAVPYFVVYQVIRYWADAMDHAGIIGAEDELHRARNHLFPSRLLSGLCYGRSEQYHLAHHLFPAVPMQHLPQLHRLLLEDPEYGALEHRFSFHPRPA